MKWLKSLFRNCGKKQEEVVLKPKQPKFKRVYSFEDLPKEPAGFIFWDTIDVEDKTSLEKIYNHIITASNLVYYCSPGAIECTVRTKKFGWCLLTLRYGLDFTAFGIYRSGTKYDINYENQLREFEPLHSFLQNFVQRAADEYAQDRNL